jgi:hypothetical protein
MKKLDVLVARPLVYKETQSFKKRIAVIKYIYYYYIIIISKFLHL